MSVIAQSYLIPLISGRHGRPATKLLSQENNKIFSSKLNVLQLKSRTFCVVKVEIKSLLWVVGWNKMIAKTDSTTTSEFVNSVK